MAALCLFLVPICIYDYIRYRIPNPLLLVVFITGLADGYIAGGAFRSFHYAVKAFLVILALFPLFKIGTIGAGDVKLLGLCAGFFSNGRILHFLFFSMLTAAVFSTVKMIRHKNLKERFAYFGGYLSGLLQTGEWKLYMEDLKSKKEAGLCLSGPILISLLIHMGGFY